MLSSPFVTPMTTSDAFFLGLLVLVVSVVWSCFYFLPSFIAYSRKHPNTFAIFLLNLLLGASFVGWVVALVWSVTSIPNAPGAAGIGPIRVEDLQAREALLNERYRKWTYFGIPCLVILVVLPLLISVPLPPPSLALSPHVVRSEVPGTLLAEPLGWDGGVLIHGESTNLEFTGTQKIGLQSAGPILQRPPDWPGVALTAEDLSLLVQGAFVESPAEFKDAQVVVRIEREEANGWYRFNGTCSVLPPLSLPEGSKTLVIKLAGAEKVRERHAANRTGATDQLADTLVDDTFSIGVSTYASRYSIDRKVLMLHLLVLLAVTFGPSLALTGFAWAEMLGWVGMSCLLPLIVAFFRLNDTLSMVSKNAGSGPLLLVLLSGCLVLNILYFAACWAIAGELRWSKLWTRVVLPSMIIPTLMLVLLILIPYGRPLLLLPASCLPGQAAACLIAFVRRIIPPTEGASVAPSP